jgi:hypothetical protein
MNPQRRTRARILTAEGLTKLCNRIREREIKDNFGRKYTREELGELTGLDPGTIGAVLDCRGSDRSSINRCFTAFGLTLQDSDHVGKTQDIDVNFIGREAAIADLNKLVRQGAKVAEGGVGKTTLALQYLRSQGFNQVLDLWMAKETQNLTPVESVLEEWLQRHFHEEAGRELGSTLGRLRQKLRDSPKRVGILIDNLEPALDQVGRFVQDHRRYVEWQSLFATAALHC